MMAPPQGRATKNWFTYSFDCSPPRKSLVKGERFMRNEGKPVTSKLYLTEVCWRWLAHASGVYIYPLCACAPSSKICESLEVIRSIVKFVQKHGRYPTIDNVPRKTIRTNKTEETFSDLLSFLSALYYLWYKAPTTCKVTNLWFKVLIYFLLSTEIFCGKTKVPVSLTYLS